jgi:hypothetical protein
MPDNWSYVLTAYGVAAVAMIGYWRYLSARARALDRARGGSFQGRSTSPNVRRGGAPAADRTSRRA